MKSSFLWIFLGFVLAAAAWIAWKQSFSGPGSFSSNPNPTPPPATPLNPGDDSAYDWERPGTPQAGNSASWTYAINPNFRSSRTFQQTADWVKWALEKYGTVQGPADANQISDVKFSGCSMEWDERRFMDHGDYVNERIYTLKLADIDISEGALQADGSKVRVVDKLGLGDPKFLILEKFWQKDGGSMKSKGDRTSRDSSAVMSVLQKDDISRRIGWALVHLVRLCGGKPSR